MKIEVKTWEELEQEFGVDEWGMIQTPIWYIEEMEQSMPPDRIIEVTEKKDSYDWTVDDGSEICWHLDKGVAK